MKFLNILLFFVTFNIVKAQQAIIDECPELCQNENVNMTNDKLIGIWYLHASIQHFFEEDMKCTFINVTELGEDHLYFVKHEFNNLTNEQRETFGAIEFINEGETHFFYTELLLPFEYQTVALTNDYWVLVTCNDCGFYSAEGKGFYAYVFTRLQYPSCELNEEVMEILKACGINKNFLIDQDQNNCPFC